MVDMYPVDKDGNMLDYEYSDAHAWVPNDPFYAVMRVVGMYSSAHSAKRIRVVNLLDGKEYEVFIKDFVDALTSGQNIINGQFEDQDWVVIKRGNNYAVRPKPKR